MRWFCCDGASILQAAVHELQEHIQEGEMGGIVATSSSGKNTLGTKKVLQNGLQSSEKRKGQQTEQAEWKPLHTKSSSKALPKEHSGAY